MNNKCFSYHYPCGRAFLHRCEVTALGATQSTKNSFLPSSSSNKTTNNFFSNSSYSSSSSIPLENSRHFYGSNIDSNGWRIMDWNVFNASEQIFKNTAVLTPSQYLAASSLDNKQLHSAVYHPEPSPVEVVMVRDRCIYIKRDDLLRLPDSNVNGNKARKLLSLSLLPVEDFPDVLVSYGGPQSNSMVALAAVVKQKDDEARRTQQPHNENYEPEDIGEDDNEDSLRDTPSNKPRLKRFVYYTKKLPRHLRDQPCGNLLRATSLGMELRQISPDAYKHFFGSEVDGGSVFPPKELLPPLPGNSAWVPQGVACGVANLGVCRLAHEIASFWQQQGKGKPLVVVLPGGTGTVALFLQRALCEIQKIKSNQKSPLGHISVCAIPCVGDTSYLCRQMLGLDLATGGSGVEKDLPNMMEVVNQRFGEPTKEILDTFNEMKNEHGVFLDLLYGAPAWTLLLRSGLAFPQDDRQIMYIHCGGLEGISTQLTRYKHKGLVDARDIQI